MSNFAENKTRLKSPSSFENKVIKKKKLDKESTLRITKNEMGGRIFVEFSSNDNKLFLQKSFQDTFDGNQEAQEFSKTIKSIKDLKSYFGMSKK
jgi:ppGpp synthetase/RelA/SpoT-type nucleotidyltranferase